MANTINSGIAALRTLESWHVDHIYGIPGGTVNNLMYALDAEKLVPLSDYLKKHNVQ
ncbi:hypothetical protein [Lactobacillus helveticus]|uniref:hypothetical protein n=1 Tax=Lactobacillus helveticus TaxID=1587 RepID=UPI001561DB7C|nr:hypothetical protein [Lactobacillus helveticus]NRO87416.1 Pyruvate oxidase [Lactobacillus helveticus]